MTFSRWVRSPFFYVCGVIILTCLWRVCLRLMRIRENRRRLDGFLLRLPVVGGALYHARLVQFTQTLSSLYSTGVPILSALPWAAQSTGSVVFEECVERVAKSVRQGVALHDALRLSREFPSFVVHLVAAGDEIGQLPEMLGFAAELGGQEIETRLQQALGSLEPIIILVMGMAVGCVVLATLSPLVRVLDGLTL